LLLNIKTIFVFAALFLHPFFTRHLHQQPPILHLILLLPCIADADINSDGGGGGSGGKMISLLEI
jgi:hypothetical protein